jgi:3-oxoacyl-[acyl-carrier protein] reductase
MSRETLLITGASSDIGLALLRRIGSLPDPPLVLAHHHQGRSRIEEAAATLPAPAQVVPVTADFTDADAVAALAERIVADHGVPTQVVHLAGLKLVYERFPKFDRTHFERDLTVQFRSAVVLLQRFLPVMAKRASQRDPAGAAARPAKIVFVLSSVTRGLPPKFLSMYTVVKHAQLGLMKALASEYAGANVTVNAVSPSMVATRFLEDLPEVAVQLAASQSPRGRHATPNEVVGAIAFLLSPDADYISGAEIPITAAATA